MKIVLAADMHLKPGVNDEQNARLKVFLDNCVEYGRLILVGDTFNCWYENNGAYAGAYQDVLGLFEKAVENGLHIDLVSGNRDFVFSRGYESDDIPAYTGFSMAQNSEYSILAKIGVHLRGWSFSLENEGQLLHFCHGDIYCIDDLWHQLLRYLLMGNPARFFAKFIPAAFVNLIFRVFGAYSRDSGRNTYEIYEHLLMKDEALRPIIDSGVDHVICGHLHQYMSREVIGVENTGLLTVLPCWAGGEYALLDNNQIIIKNTSYS